ncbi:hypothetical protein B5M09_001789 [Aphanomyces astaci]|uniref:Uncharacterized protein n=1 Tax=Aphanomyces astaci TaxID=112090 RepID=A0A3R7XX00_APHAT|nr:hypothetical protein B5M09_001789 [Aphanomyces astaci]
MLVRPSHHDEVILNTTTLPFTAFVMSYFMVFPRKVPSTSHESSADSKTTYTYDSDRDVFRCANEASWERPASQSALFTFDTYLVLGCIEPDAEIRQGPAWASWECARLVVSVQVHVQGAVGVDWLGYFAVFLGLSRTLTLPLPRALDAFLLARRMLYATTVMRQRHADPSSMDVIWVMAKDAMLPSAAYSLHTTAVKILGTFTRTPGIFGAALTHDDGSISYGEFVTMWGFIDSTIPLDRLCTIYMHVQSTR